MDIVCNLQHHRLEQVQELFRKVDDRRKVLIYLSFLVKCIVKSLSVCVCMCPSCLVISVYSDLVQYIFNVRKF